MSLFALSALAAGIVALMFGGLVILKDSRKLNNRLFFLMTLSISMWGVSYWFWLSNTNSAEEARLWVNLLTIGSLLAVMFYTHWILVVTRAHGLFWSTVLGATYGLVTGFIAILFLYPNLLVGIIGPKLFFPLWPSAGPLYLYHIIAAYILPVSFALGRVVHQLFAARNKKKRGQLISILIGTLFGFSGAAINFFLWFDIPILPYGNFGIIVFPPLLAYSIIRYKLFTFRTIATELLVLFTVTGVFVQIFLAQSFVNLLLQIIFFVAVAASSYMLLRSVYNEVETRQELERLTEKLKTANVRLKELDRQKSEFLSIATHQLRGPLAGIRGHLSLVVDGSYGQIPARARDVIQRVFSSSGMLAQTINDFLDVSRIEQGRMKYEMKDFECNSLIAGIIEELVPLAEDRKLKLLFEDECKNACVVHADYGKLRHIFFNLIDNAIKYTEKGWVKARITRDGKNMRAEISDSGIGIDSSEIGGLFEKFVRARGASGVNVNGTGLGLYVARQMVEAHKGKIWAESEGKGKGSTFIVELPTITSSTRNKNKK